jgi:hypothetical protein
VLPLLGSLTWALAAFTAQGKNLDRGGDYALQAQLALSSLRQAAL